MRLPHPPMGSGSGAPTRHTAECTRWGCPENHRSTTRRPVRGYASLAVSVETTGVIS